jgi:hypothetical protein
MLDVQEYIWHTVQGSRYKEKKLKAESSKIKSDLPHIDDRHLTPNTGHLSSVFCHPSSAI